MIRQFQVRFLPVKGLKLPKHLRNQGKIKHLKIRSAPFKCRFKNIYIVTSRFVFIFVLCVCDMKGSLFFFEENGVTVSNR